MKKKIAILICDIPTPEIKLTHGDYTDLFSQLLKHDKLDFTSFEVFNRDFPGSIHDFDGFLITGSKYSANDNNPWILELLQLIQKIDDTDKKMIGICFGHQIIARALGGTVEKNSKGWEVGRSEFTLSYAGVQFLGTEKDRISIQEMHQDHVVSVPKGFQVIGYNEISQVQMMIKKDKYWCIQGHPEYSAEFVRDLLLMRQEKGIFSKEFVQESLKVIKDPIDTSILKESIILFLI